MAKKLPLSDFRAVRMVLEPDDFALSDGEDAAPSDLIAECVWHGIMNLPDDVAIRASDHNGRPLKFLYDLWGAWIDAMGDPVDPDELHSAMLDASACFQCSDFNLLHGFYRGALGDLRTALELMMIGTYGSLNPTDPDYVAWKNGHSDLNFPRCRRRLKGSLTGAQCKWLFEEDGLFASLYERLCNYAHSRPDCSDGALWESNGPVYNPDGFRLTYFTALAVYAASYLLARLGRATFVLPNAAKILFEVDRLPEHETLARAHSELFNKVC